MFEIIKTEKVFKNVFLFDFYKKKSYEKLFEKNAKIFFWFLLKIKNLYKKNFNLFNFLKTQYF